LSTKITELLPSQKAVKAKKLCETGWVERHGGIVYFLEILPAVICVLDDLSSASTSTMQQATPSKQRPAFVNLSVSQA